MLKKVSMLALLCAVTVGSAYSSMSEDGEKSLIPKFNTNSYSYDAAFNVNAKYASENVFNQIFIIENARRYLVTNTIDIFIDENGAIIGHEINGSPIDLNRKNPFTFKEEAHYFSIKGILETFEKENDAKRFIDFCKKQNTENANNVLNLYYLWGISGTKAILDPFKIAYIKESKDLLENFSKTEKNDPNNLDLIGVRSAIKVASSGDNFDFTKNDALDEIFNAAENREQNLANVISVIPDLSTLNNVEQISKAIQDIRNEYAGSKAITLDTYEAYSSWAVNTIGRGMIVELSKIEDNNDCVAKIKAFKDSLKKHEAKHKGFVEFLDTTLNIFAIFGKKETEDFLNLVSQYQREKTQNNLDNKLRKEKLEQLGVKMESKHRRK